MDNSSEKRIAIVSGGSGGIGRAVVLRLAKGGFFPVILDKNGAAGQEVMELLERQDQSGEFVALDLTKKSQVQEAFTKISSLHGRIDLLVNLQGGTLHAGLIQDFPLHEWREVLDVNLKATFLCSQAAIPIMKQRQKGAIINTSSNFAVTGSATRTAYAASKAAIIGFTKSLALELAPHGIRVNAIAPGLTATKRVKGQYSPEVWAEFGRGIPMGRTAEPEEIAEGVTFLASEESNYITGQTLHVNGAMVTP